MKSIFSKLPIIVECLMVCVILVFAYELYDLCEMLHKPLLYFIIPTAITIFISMMFRGQEELAKCPEIRKYVLPLCRPYQWVEKLNQKVWKYIHFCEHAQDSHSSCFYPLFSFLPILPINLAVTSTIYIASWGSTISVLWGLFCVVVTFIAVGIFSHSAIELSYRIAAEMTLRLKKNKGNL